MSGFPEELVDKIVGMWWKSSEGEFDETYMALVSSSKMLRRIALGVCYRFFKTKPGDPKRHMLENEMVLRAVRSFRYLFSVSTDWERLHDLIVSMPGLRRLSMDCGGLENVFVNEQLTRRLPGGMVSGEGGLDMFRLVQTRKRARRAFAVPPRAVVMWVESRRWLSTLSWLELRSYNGLMEQEWLTACVSRGQTVFPCVKTLILGGLPDVCLAGCLLQDFLIHQCPRVELVQVDNAFVGPWVPQEDVLGFTQWPSGIRHLKFPWRFLKGEVPKGLVSISLVQLEDADEDDICGLLGAVDGAQVIEVSFVHPGENVLPQLMSGVRERFPGLRRIHICVRDWDPPRQQFLEALTQATLSLKMLEEVLFQLEVDSWNELLNNSDEETRTRSEEACKKMLAGNPRLWTVTIRDTRWKRVQGRVFRDLEEAFLEMLQTEVQWPVLSDHHPRVDYINSLPEWL